MEIWKHIKGYEERYAISNLGRVWNLKTDKVLKNIRNPSTGYAMLSLCKNGVRRTARVHVLVAQAFLPKTGRELNHKDGDKMNPRLDNLEWVAPHENIRHAINRGLWHHRNNKQTLDEYKVAAIRAALKVGVAGIKLAKEFGVTPAMISMIKNNKTYTWALP